MFSLCSRHPKGCFYLFLSRTVFLRKAVSGCCLNEDEAHRIPFGQKPPGGESLWFVLRISRLRVITEKESLLSMSLFVELR